MAILPLQSSCVIDVEFFPYDIQTCRLKLGSWTYDGLQVTSNSLTTSHRLYLTLPLPLNINWPPMITPTLVNNSAEDTPNLNLSFKEPGYILIAFSSYVSKVCMLHKLDEFRFACQRLKWVFIGFCSSTSIYFLTILKSGAFSLAVWLTWSKFLMVSPAFDVSISSPRTLQTTCQSLTTP